MCDGEPIWTQQGAVVEHVAEREKKKVSKRVFSALAHGQKAAVWSRVVSKYSYLFVKREVSPNEVRSGETGSEGKEERVLDSSCE